MQFDERTIKLLGNYALINKNIYFAPGRTISSISEGKTIFSRAGINSEIEQEFALSDLPKFLRILKLFEAPSSEITAKTIVLKEGLRQVSFTLTPPELVEKPPDRDIKFTADVSFQFLTPVVSDIKAAASSLGHSELAVVGDGQDIFLETLNVDNPTSDSYRAKVANSSKKFRIVLRLSNFLVLPQDYEASIMFGKMFHLKSEGLEYFVAIEQRHSESPHD